MEDGIERNLSSLVYKEDPPLDANYLYLCLPREGCITDLKITFDKNKAISFSKENIHTIVIYKKNEENLYVISRESLRTNN
jgi:hypothetical protein